MCIRDSVWTGRLWFFQAEDGIRDLVRSRGLGDVYKRQDLVERISKENKEVWQQRNDAIRSYNGLIEMGKSARDLGIDTKDWKLPEEEKDKFKDYKFSIDHKVLESGKVQYAAKLTRRKKG